MGLVGTVKEAPKRSMVSEWTDRIISVNLKQLKEISIFLKLNSQSNRINRNQSQNEY